MSGDIHVLKYVEQLLVTIKYVFFKQDLSRLRIYKHMDAPS